MAFCLVFSAHNVLKTQVAERTSVCKRQLAKIERWSVALIAPPQCRAARALLDWTQAQLAEATGLSAVTIRAFEGGREARDSNRTLLQLALEKAGVEFIAENGGGAGVRLRKGESR